VRPVSAEFPVTQSFGSLATAGVTGNMNGTQVQVLVALYGNYQPYGHAGCDIGCPVGTNVYAIKAGTVVWCDWDVNLPGDDSTAGYLSRWDFYKSFGGRIILLKHDDGTYSDYCHLSKFLVANGQRVNEGDLIALSGDSSGGQDGVLGPHLHTEYLVDLSYSTGNGLIYGRTDPEPYFGNTTPLEDDMPLNDDDKAEIKRLATEGALAALSWAIDTDDGKKLSVLGMVGAVMPKLNRLPDDIVHNPFSWFGFDGKQPATGRTTTTLAISAGWQDASFHGVPAAVANQKLQLKDGRVVNVAAALDELLSKSNTAPVGSAPAPFDVEAFVTRLKTELPAATVAEIKAQWNK
jgi:hypothetical protein